MTHTHIYINADSIASELEMHNVGGARLTIYRRPLLRPTNFGIGPP